MKILQNSILVGLMNSAWNSKKMLDAAEKKFSTLSKLTLKLVSKLGNFNREI